MKLNKLMAIGLSFLLMLPNQVRAFSTQSSKSEKELIGKVLVNGDNEFDCDDVKNEDSLQWHWMSYPESRFVLHPSTLDNPYKDNLNLRMGLLVHGIKDESGFQTLNWEKENNAENKLKEVNNTWYPYQLTADAKFEEGNVNLSEFFVDKNTVVRKFDIQDMKGSVSISSDKLGGFQKLTLQDNILIHETDRYYIAYRVVALDDKGDVSEVIEPTINNDKWNVKVSLSNHQQFAVSMTLGVKNVNDETIDTVVSRTKETLDSKNYSTMLTATKEFWDQKLSNVPAPTLWGIQAGLDTKGVTPQQHKRAFYAAWAFNYQNILEETPETGYNYKQITLGKASMWGSGAPESPNNCSWESMFNIQQMAYLEPDIAWSAIEGFIDGIDENGILRGECLPSQKAHTVWVCHENQSNTDKLKELYPKLKNYLTWRAKNPRWIYGGHNYEDEKDISFVTQWFSDVDYVIKICKEIGQYSDIAMWENLKEQMYKDMKDWFFTPQEGDPAGKIYNSYFTSDGSHYKYDRQSDVDNYIAEALYVDLPEDMLTQLIDYYLDLHDNTKDLVGFDFYKYGDGCYIAYGLLEKALKDDRLQGKGEEFINAVLRNVIKTVEFSEESKPDDYRPSGVKPSSFTASAVIDYTYLNNDVRIDSGKLTLMKVGDTKIDQSSISLLETSVLKGKSPILPKQIAVSTLAGQKLDVLVNWESYDQELCNKAGSFIVKGRIAQSSLEVEMKVLVYEGDVQYDVLERTVLTNQIPQLPSQVHVKYKNNNIDYNDIASIEWENMSENQFVGGSTVKVKGHFTFNNQEVEATIQVLGKLNIQTEDGISHIDRYDSMILKVVDNQGNEINGVDWSIKDSGNRPIANINSSGKLLGVQSGKVTVIADLPKYNTTLEKEITVLQKNSGTLSYHAETTVTSQADSARGGAQAVDGNDLTMWRAKDNDDQSIVINLKKVCELTGISNLWFEETQPKKYRVSVSLDNQTWEEVCTKSTSGYVKESVRGIVVFDKVVQAQYVKVEVIENGSFQVGIQELEVYGNIKDSNLMTDMSIVSDSGQLSIDKKASTLQLNISTNTQNADTRVEWEVLGVNGKPTCLAQINENGLLTPLSDGVVEVVAKAIDGSGLIAKQRVVLTNQLLENVALHQKNVSATTNSQDASKAIDGDLLTRWGSAMNAPQKQEFKVDFGTELNVNSIVIYCDAGAYPIDFEMQYWNGSAFVPLAADVKDNDSPNIRYDFDSVTTKAVRIQSLKTTNQTWGFSIWEFEVYGTTPKSVIKNLYNIYKDLDENTYQTTGWKEFKAALDTVKNLIEQENPDQHTMDLAAKELQNTFEALVLRNDVLSLNDAIEKANAIDKDIYTPKSIKNMEKVLSKANEVSENRDSSIKSIDEAEKNLLDAIQKLVKKADFSALNDILEEAKKVDTTLYTENSLEELNKVLTKAQDVFDNQDATQAEVDEAKTLLEEAMNALVKKANFDDLNHTIEEAKKVDMTLYTEKSLEEFNNVLIKAQDVFKNQNATQKEVDEVKLLLDNAIKSLVRKADKKELENLLNEVNQLDKTLYTEESYALVEAEYNKVQKVYEDENATDKQVQEAYEGLKTAMDKLVKKVAIDPEEPQIITIKNSDETVIVTGKLPKDIELSVAQLSQEALDKVIADIKQLNSEFFVNATIEKVLDIELYLKGEKYSLEDGIEIILKIDESLKDKQLGIIYIDEEGNIEKIESIRDGDYMKFKVTHLSRYAIVSYDKEDENTAKPGEIEVPGKSETAKTEDATSLYVFVGLTILSVAGVYLSLKKRREE